MHEGHTFAGRQFSKPLLIDNGEVRTLRRLTFEDRTFDEARLQSLLIEHVTLGGIR